MTLLTQYRHVRKGSVEVYEVYMYNRYNEAQNLSRKAIILNVRFKRGPLVSSAFAADTLHGSGYKYALHKLSP
jgi:hypothetical protein